MEAVLSQSVLVLNRHWMVIHVTNLRRAFCLLFQGYARVVGEDLQTYDFESWREISAFEQELEDSGAYVATPGFRIRAPEVIQLTAYSRVPPRRVKFSRRNIFLRDNYMCQYCGTRPLTSELTIDHILPRSRGGKSTWDNVVLCCVSCNTRKGSRLPLEANMKLLSKPKRPNWLVCTLKAAQSENRPMWERFIDQAYWNVELRE
jgi:5-methylcytosine-specific restriction endonuclease McrA